MNKKISAIFLLYFFQFVATSCEPCDCPPSKTYERIYNGLEVKAWNTSGFQSEEVSETVYKNSFGLSISVEFELKQIAFYKQKFELSSFGFASAYACDCLFDEYINVDPLKSIIITVTDIQSQEVTDVTSNFYTYGYNGEKLTISKLFENRADWHDAFQLDMIEYDNIPDSANFKVKITLESGKEFIEQTQDIYFE